AVAAGGDEKAEHRIRGGGRLERKGGEPCELDGVDGPDLDPCRRARKPRQVLVELERVATVHPRRLERSAAAQERLVVNEEDRLVGVDKSASADCEGEQRHLAAGS